MEMVKKLLIICSLVSVLFFNCARSKVPQDNSLNWNFELVSIFYHHLDLRADDIWPGWNDNPNSLLLRDENRDWLFNFDYQVPDGFTVYGNKNISDTGIWILEGHLTPVPLASVWQVGDIWAAAIPMMEQFQIAVDRALGAGKVKIDEDLYLQTLFHEIFHSYQFNLTGGQLGNIASFNENKALEEIRANAGWYIQIAKEGKALYDILTAENQIDIERVINDFILLNNEHRANYSENLRNYVDYIETIEGTAVYAGALMMENIKPGAKLEFLNSLKNLSKITTGEREIIQTAGAAKALILDLIDPRWKVGFLENNKIISEKLITVSS